MVILCISFLFACYYLKIVAPEEFALSISNDRVLMIGDIIDNSLYLTYLTTGITSFVTYYLYCCAACSRIKFRLLELLEIIITVLLVRFLSLYDTALASGVQLASFLFLPAIMKGSLRNSAVTYTVHCVSQGLSLSIRNLPLYFNRINSAVAIIAGSECYVWLILMATLFYRKEK